MVVNDNDGQAPPVSVAHIKRERIEVGGSAQGSSSRVLPSHPGHGGSSQDRRVQEGEMDEEDDEEEDDSEDKGGEDLHEEPTPVGAQGGSQEVPQEGTQPPVEEDEDDDDLYDPTGYHKADIIDLRDGAFRDDTEEARLIKGCLLGLPEGKEPSIEQINASALFAPRPPSKEYKDEVQDEDEETNT